MRPKVTGVLVFLVCLSLLWSALSVGAGLSDARASTRSGESALRIGFVQRVDSLNPMLGSTDASKFFYGLVYDSMFYVSEDLEPVGNLVTDWEIVPTTDPELVASGEPYGSVWEYDLTVNAVWHDGEPFTCGDLVWAINMAAQYYADIWSYQPYTYFMEYAEAVDEDTVRIHFFDRWTGLPMAASYGDSIHIPIVPRHLLSSYTASEMSFAWTGVFEGLSMPIVGTGPFIAIPTVFEDFVQGDMITLVRNPNYHALADRGEAVRFDKVMMLFFDDPVAMRLALSAGQLDVAQFPARDYCSLEAALESGSIEDIQTYDGLKCTQSWTAVGFNMYDSGPNPARMDPAVRHALALATDKQFIVDNFYLGLADVGSTMISPLSDAWHYEPSAGEAFVYDPEAASQLLEDSGYIYTDASPDVRVASVDSYAVQTGLVVSETPLAFDMVVKRDYPEQRESAEYLKAQWADIGVRLDLLFVDEDIWPTYVYSYNYDLSITSWDSDPDPNRMLFCQSVSAWNGWSDNRYCNETYDMHYNASVAATDPEVRKMHVDECQRIHYADVGHLVLAYPYQTYAWRTDTFLGWGDWAEHPGRSLDAYWGASPLLFDLIPMDVTDLVPYEQEGRFSLLVPGGWTVREDVLVGTTEFDLYVTGPVYGAVQTTIALDSERVRDVKETREWLEYQMDEMMYDLAELGVNVTVIRAPTDWEGANHSALRFAIEWDQGSLVQDITICAEEESGKAWVLICTVHRDAYGLLGFTFERVSQSLDLSERDDMVTVLYVAIGMAVAATAAVAVVALYLLRHRRPPADAARPSAYDNVRPGLCPNCAAQLPPGAAFCPVCGGRAGGSGP